MFDFDEFGDLTSLRSSPSNSNAAGSLRASEVHGQARKQTATGPQTACGARPGRARTDQAGCADGPSAAGAGEPGGAAHAPSSPGPTRPARVAIIAKGSRGDVQPVVALALRLQHVGVSVKVVTNHGTEAFIQDFGLAAEGYPWEADASLDVRADNEDQILDTVCPRWATGKESRAIFEKVKAYMPALLLYKRFSVAEALVIEEQLHIRAVEYGFCPDSAIFPAGTDGAEFRFKLVSRKKRLLDKYMGITTLRHLTVKGMRGRP
eukprot:CAMPEP_0168425884 /NCGR_PEP_ID=MMETSP0228-20121227/35549_1 /TAXON_ID=133427 /ORGANISM="Protoceratium reticulatum, Strain CCCM 535 (=CCMP 1889)" /LENGTH=263 /DNA_ID=CAMNT_0008439881 /DNA_START=29 /DNA_END=816 /DNA_ORIENTATION=+